MKLKDFAFIFVLFIAANSALAQYNDFGSWNALSIDKDMRKGFDLGAKVQTRLNENASEFASFILDISLKYKVNDFLRFGGVYRLGQSRTIENFYEPRHRFAADMYLNSNIGEFKCKYRMRFQSGDNNLSSDEGALNYKNVFRNKISFSRKVIKKTTAWTSFECFSENTEDNSIQLSDWRWKIGIDRKVKKRQVVGLGFLIQSEVNTANPVTEYVLLASYEIELKKRKKKSNSDKTTPKLD